jgi:myo-inositol-1(or 4)-monophosphatase
MSSSDLDLIRTAAGEAGAMALRMLTEGRVKTSYKDGGSPVTNADLALDRELRTRLLEARPDYGWLSEETEDDSSRLSARRAFVVDPIDGTFAFIRGRPWWAVSIAVVEDGEPVVGVLEAPALGETYAAEAGVGAWLNGEPIGVSNRAELEGCAVLADARTLQRHAGPEPWPEMRIESRNSVAYRMALVASGAFDATVALSAKNDWDLAAADLIAREAGAVATDHLGQRFVYNRPSARKRSLICAGPTLHRLILDRVGHIELPG